MTETKFTPGPWSLARGEVHHVGRLVITAKGMPPNSPLAFVGGADWDDAAQNDAALIAAAPDLYAALARIVESVARGASGDVCQTSDFDDARAALSKARGET